MGKLAVGNITLRPAGFRWKIDNFSRLTARKCYSDIFSTGSHKWRLLIFPKGSNTRHLSMYLDVVKSAKLPNVNYRLAVVNQVNYKHSVIHVGQHQFTERKRIWGRRSFMRLSRLNDPHGGYIVNDTCIVECEVAVSGVMDNSICYSKKVLPSKSMIVEPLVGVPVKVVTPAKEMDPVAALVRINEGIRVVESENEVTVIAVRKRLSEIAHVRDYPNAGQLFEEGRHQDVACDPKFENIGGFSVLKTQAPLYKQIWLKCGHIATSRVLTCLYSVQVSVVTEIMTSIMDMHHQRLAEVSSEIIDSWETMIKVAEKLEFNIRWLRECFEDVKKYFYGEQKLKTALLEQDQAKKQLIAAEEHLNLAKDEFKKGRENLFALENKVSELLSERRQDVHQGSCLLLFDDYMSLSTVMVHNQKDAPPKVKPVDKSPIKTMPPPGSAGGTMPSTPTSAAKVENRKSISDDRDGEPSKRKVKMAENEPISSAKDGSTPPSTFSSSRNSHVPPRSGMPSSEFALTESVDPLFRENNFRAAFLQDPTVTTEDLVKEFWAICHSQL